MKYKSASTERQYNVVVVFFSRSQLRDRILGMEPHGTLGTAW